MLSGWLSEVTARTQKLYSLPADRVKLGLTLVPAVNSVNSGTCGVSL